MTKAVETYNRHKDHICTEKCIPDIITGLKSDIPLLVEIMTNEEKDEMRKALNEDSKGK